MKRLLATASFLLALTLGAADFTWTGTAGDGFFSNPRNWADLKLPSANDGTETIHLGEQGAGTITFLGGNIRLKAIEFSNTTPYTFVGNGLTIDLDGGVTLGAGNVTFDKIQIAGKTLQVNGSGKLYINNPIANTSVDSLEIKGTGMVIMTGKTGSSQKYTLSSGYFGYTEGFARSFADFLQNINAITDPNAIVGIDSNDPGTLRTVSDSIDLSLLDGNDGTGRVTSYYIGTTSRIDLTGFITPTIGSDTLYLAALDDGYLKISSQLGGSASPVNAVVVGQAGLANQGTVELAASNSYTGGTRVLGGTLFVNTNNALGNTTGLVSVSSGATLNLGSSASVTLHNPVNLEPGSTITGLGNYMSNITLNTGVTLVPGGYGKTGYMHLHGGLTIEAGAIWDIDLTTTTSDSLCVWHYIDILGDRTIPIVINLNSVSGGDYGPLINFDPEKNYSWQIAYRPSGDFVISGFDPDYFYINTESLLAHNLNLAGLGDFNIEQINNALHITFTPIPEPGTYALMLLGLATLGIAKYRRRRRE